MRNNFNLYKLTVVEMLHLIQITILGLAITVVCIVQLQHQ